MTIAIRDEPSTRRLPLIAGEDPVGEMDTILDLLVTEYGRLSRVARTGSTHGKLGEPPAEQAGSRRALIACCRRLRATGIVDLELTRGLELMLRDASDVEVDKFVSFLPVRPRRRRKQTPDTTSAFGLQR